MKKLLTVFIIAFISNTLSFSKDKWSLQECIDYALKHNISIQLKRIDEENTSVIVKTAKMEFLPSLNFSMEHNLNWGRSVDLQTLEIVNNKLTQNTGMGIGASVYLLDGLSKIYDMKIYRLQHQIAGFEKEAAKEEIAISVIKAYLQTLLSAEILSTIEKNIGSLKQQKEIIETFVLNNRSHNSSLLEIKGEEAAQQMELANAINLHQNNILSLKELLNIGIGEPFEIEGHIVTFPTDSGEISMYNNLDLLKKYHPTILSWDKKIEADKYSIKKAKGKLFPTIGISGSYSTFYSSTATQPDGSILPFGSQLKENINPSVGISLTIPIFNNGKYRMEITRNNLQKRHDELQLIRQQQLIEKRLTELLLETKKSLRRMESAQKHLKYMEESLEYAKIKLESGKIDSASYTDIFRRESRARSDYLREKYQYLFNMEIVKFYNNFSLKFMI